MAAAAVFAADFVRRGLADGPRPATDFLAPEALKAAGFSERTLRSAVRDVGVVSERRSGRWWWRLPADQGCTVDDDDTAHLPEDLRPRLRRYLLAVRREALPPDPDLRRVWFVAALVGDPSIIRRAS